MGMNVNANAYGGYYTSNGFYQKKEAVKNKEEVASAIGNDEMEAVLKEKDPELLEQLKGVTSKVWNNESVSGASSIIKKAMDYVYEQVILRVRLVARTHFFYFRTWFGDRRTVRIRRMQH